MAEDVVIRRSSLRQNDEPQKLFLSQLSRLVNLRSIVTPYPITAMIPYIPYYVAPRMFDALSRSFHAPSIRDRKRFQPSDLPGEMPGVDQFLEESAVSMLSGHQHGHLFLWNSHTFDILAEAEHYNHVSVRSILLTSTKIITLVDASSERRGSFGRGGDNDIYVWDANTLELVGLFSGHESRVHCAALMEPERNIADVLQASLQGSTRRGFSGETSTNSHRGFGSVRHEKSALHAATADSEDTRLFSGGGDGVVLEWDVEQLLPVPVQRWKAHALAVTQLSLSRSHYLASGSADCTIRIWDVDQYRVSSKQLPSSDSTPPSQANVAVLIQVLEGHQGAISHLYLDETVLRSACAGGLIRCYEVRLEEEEAEKLGHASRTTPPPNDAKVAAEKLSGTSAVTPSPIAQLQWSHKAHKAMVTGVEWDERITVSCSATDGVSFFNASTTLGFKMSHFDQGVRQVALDPKRRLAICAVDNGQLTVMWYKRLFDLRPGENRDDVVSVASTLQLHSAAINCLRIERGAEGQWERILSASNDRTICELDFDLHRGSQSYDSVETSPSLVVLPRTNALVWCCGNRGTLWDTQRKVCRTGPESKLEGHTQRINCVTYIDETKLLVTGSADETLRLWPVAVQESDVIDGEADELVLPSSELRLPLGYTAVCLSAAHRSVVAVGVSKKETLGDARVGGVLLLDSKADEPLSSISVLPHAPHQVDLFGYAARPTMDPAAPFTLLIACHLRTGDVELLRSSDDARIHLEHLFALYRAPPASEADLNATLSNTNTVTAAPFSITVSSSTAPQRGKSLQTPTFHSLVQSTPVAALPPVVVSLDDGYSPPRLNVLSADRRGVRWTSVATDLPLGSLDATDDTIGSGMYNKEADGLAATWGAKVEFSINVAHAGAVVAAIAMLHPAPLACATAMDSGLVDIRAVDGRCLFEVAYDGSTRDCQLVGGVDGATARRRTSSSGWGWGRGAGDGVSTSSPSVGLSQQRFASCASVVACKERRELAIGFADGIVLVWHLAMYRTIRRIVAVANSPIVDTLFVGKQSLVIRAANGTLRFDQLHQRTISPEQQRKSIWNV